MTSFRNFLITFLVSVLLFGIVGYFTTVFVSGVINDLVDSGGNAQADNQGANDADDPSSPSDGEKVPEGDSFTALFVFTDYDPVNHSDYIPNRWETNNFISSLDRENPELGILLKRSRHVHATGIVLVRADKDLREYLICYITPETRVYTSSGAMSLGNVYGNYGVNALKGHIKALTGIRPDFHFVIDGYRMSEVVESLGRYSVDLESEIYSYGDYYMLASEFSAEEKAAAFDPAPAPADEKPEETETADYDEEIVQPPQLERALFAGTHELDRDTLRAVFSLKECSLENVEFKGALLLDVVEHYLRKAAQYSKGELESIVSSLTENAPYATDYPLDMKPALATDFTSSDVGGIFEVIGAIEYFKVTPFIYPGNYVATKDADIGYYVPTLRTAVEDLVKYR